jgi:ATP:corrinoid adenosyltransferase
MEEIITTTDKVRVKTFNEVEYDIKKLRQEKRELKAQVDVFQEQIRLFQSYQIADEIKYLVDLEIMNIQNIKDGLQTRISFINKLLKE